MPDPTELLAVARHLSSQGVQAAPTDAQLRRAVSTAYYALFHKVVQAAALRFVGQGQQRTAGYAIVYRGFEHNRMSDVCEELKKPTPRVKYRQLLHRRAFSQHTRDFATAFSELPVKRHLADYDPLTTWQPSDVSDIVDAAEEAMDAFDRIPSDEQTDILALMMVRVRD